MKKQSKKIEEEVVKFLQERSLMIKDGFPYCYTENFVQFHCESCRNFWKKRKETHEPLEEGYY